MPSVFNYAAEQPPAPYVLATVAKPDGSTTADVAVKLDTGASRTVVPTELADALGLDVVERRVFEGLGGNRIELALVRLVLTIRGCSPVEVVAASSAGEPYVLLGRDVLNLFRIVFDGPRGKVEFP